MVLIKKIIIYFMKVILTLFTLFLITFIFVVVSDNGFFSLGRLAKGINKTSVSSIQLGMTKCDIIKILGIPFSESIYPAYNMDGFSYSKNGMLWGVDIYLSFENGKLIRVFMEEGDVPFYMYDNKKYLTKKINYDTYNKIIPDAPNLEKKRYDEIHSKTP